MTLWSLQMTVGENLWPGGFFANSPEINDSTIHYLIKGLSNFGVVDWEFTYAAPAEFSFAPPWWLLIEKPEYWTEGLEDWTEVFGYRLKTFLKVMRDHEDASIQQGRLKENQRLSGPMSQSWESGDFWIMAIPVLFEHCITGEDSNKDKLSAIKQWFRVLSEAVWTAALYALLQQTTQVQIRFFIQVLQQMSQGHPILMNQSYTGERIDVHNDSRSAATLKINPYIAHKNEFQQWWFYFL
ncbi:hypothetical protein N7454_005152 [Penicillium verhagenii]|nr:hypothetical protein N7454_005152 [Penicillium verhagenii]